MGSSADKSYPITFLYLPNDILCEILDYFQFVDRNGNKINWKNYDHRQAISTENKARRQAVQRIRLVCRHLCQLASPLLCPVLRVSLDQESLDAVVHLSQNPFIAAGVRGMVIFLGYRPQELAINLTQYIKHQRENLGNIERQCYQFARRGFSQNRDAETWHEQRAPWPSWFKRYLKLIYRIHSACLAWNTDRSTAENISHAHDEVRSEAQEIILQGFRDYQQRHEKQSQLVTDGLFVESLASCIIHLPNADGVIFSHAYNDLNIDDDDVLSFRQKTNVPAVMAAPLNWLQIEELEGGGDIIPARILVELPIAFHRSGAKLHSISIECFPNTRGSPLIAPGQLSNFKWGDLRECYQYLKQFHLGGWLTFGPLRYDYLMAQGKDPIDHYLEAVFSSKCLEHLDISFHSPGSNDGRNTTEGFYRLGPNLRTVEWQRMRRLNIAHVECGQDELEKLCRSLGQSLEELTWCSIKLQKGNWFRVFDFLRERLQERYLRQRFRARIRHLLGGEFGSKEVNQQRGLQNAETNWGQDEEMYTQIEKYICDDGLRENPLVGPKLRQNEN